VSGELRFRIGGVQTEVRISQALDLGQAAGPAGTVSVFDTTTSALFGEGAENPVVLQPGEPTKQWASAERVLSRCAAAGLGRDGVVAGIGGGVVCDIAAFSASLYMRGCGLVLIPTTLLAMVDAGLGGKTGLDFLGYKNLVGTFYPARLVLAATGCLRHLPAREFLCGIAEAVKTAVVGDRTLFAILRDDREAVLARDEGLLEEIVRRCLAVKGRIVEEDPVETGSRALLNLGHTFGHALESATGFSVWSHGEAVAWGMGRALSAGLLLGITEPGFAAALRGVLESYGFRMTAGVRYPDLVAGFARDKKRRAGRVRLVIPRGLGDCVVREADDQDIARALES
jgi:3-dehydroquinate synthase